MISSEVKAANVRPGRGVRRRSSSFFLTEVDAREKENCDLVVDGNVVRREGKKKCEEGERWSIPLVSSLSSGTREWEPAAEISLWQMTTLLVVWSLAMGEGARASNAADKERPGPDVQQARLHRG